MAGKVNDQARMPPPESPSRSPRRYDSSQPRTDISNAFSDSVKLEVARMSGSSCWSCTTPDPEYAHVVAQKDGQAPYWIKAGLFPFSFKTAVNCIPLCPTCHSAFDRSSDPCWVFLPTNLAFFIKWEMEDRARRTQVVGQPDRTVPTIATYRDHIASQGLVSDDAVGGLYRGYFLKDFLRPMSSPNAFEVLATPKVWHGHPMAAIRRGIAILGSARCYALDRATLDQLATLRRLYFDDTSLIDKKLSQVYHIPSAGHKRKRSEDKSDHNDQKRRPSDTNIHETVQDAHDVGNGQGTRHVCALPTPSFIDIEAHNDFYAPNDWVLGPNATGNDAIQRFAPLFQSRDVVKLLR
ncbi:hypothetical protein BDV38DRAFT_273141 [Aspergillus pseudotamarii]|uniref:HNH nuclease domain-containing protein n=1 Tax=Aspergillus pseudotamarii TaxID=132259 RepID=A0A5N6SJQ3_ASPPS|nr:uncharacterized protein BDV38DRAFT_273141 [Aspergillus pseudotamarii]KAE8134922.1 hypothetical protein BDV38DRAFT_273141 [Aspergillus pseudotamarii]